MSHMNIDIPTDVDAHLDYDRHDIALISVMSCVRQSSFEGSLSVLYAQMEENGRPSSCPWACCSQNVRFDMESCD